MPNLGGYIVTFVSAICNPNGTQTWTYNITIDTINPPTADISHWTLELCPTGPEAQNPSPDGTDPIIDPPVETGNFNDLCLGPISNGIKWNYVDDIMDEVAGDYSFTLEGCFEQTNVRVTVKAGGGNDCPPENNGIITGPSCFALGSKPSRGTPFSEEEKLTSLF